MLILFDIDGTLLLTRNAGARAMTDAGRAMFGDHFTLDGIAISGRLDPLIWFDAARAAGLDDPMAHHDRFRATYGEQLRRRLAEKPTAVLLPGVRELIDALTNNGRPTLGLLTGNYPETGRLKIESAGLDPDIFTITAWGCDGAHRRDLPGIALDLYQQRHGRTLDGGQVVIIGDTPHDVDCAQHHGCRCIAVATGRYSVDELAECNPDLVVENLSNTASLMEWMMQEGAAISET